MTDNYFNYYVLSYFKIDEKISLNQIYHVLKGKKTPSMYYIVEKNQWHHGFSLEKRIEKKNLKRQINYFLKKSFLVQENENYLLTNKGAEALDHFFKNHYYPSRIKSFENIDIYSDFWEQILLYTQVFSEYSYKNSNYQPIISKPDHQENIRQLFQWANQNLDTVLMQWKNEQLILLNHLERNKANVLANLLTGHEQTGQTRVQIANHLGMMPYEFDFYLKDIIEDLIQIIEKHQKELALSIRILKQSKKANFLSLSKSTYISYEMLKNGYSIQKIARHRRIKEGTVKEHLLEMAFTIKNFPVKKFIEAADYKYLSQLFTEKEEILFKDIPSEKRIEFFQYRLVELERMRAIERVD